MNNKKASEKSLEKRLREGITRRGGVCLKFTSVYNTGWPDRIIFMPNGLVFLAEIKSEGLLPTEKQLANINKAKKLRLRVFLINSEASLKAAIAEMNVKSDEAYAD